MMHVDKNHSEMEDAVQIHNEMKFYTAFSGAAGSDRNQT